MGKMPLAKDHQYQVKARGNVVHSTPDFSMAVTWACDAVERYRGTITLVIGRRVLAQFQGVGSR